MANVPDIKTRSLILKLLVEGNSMCSTSRIAGVSINTVSKLLVDTGNACSKFHDKTIRNVKAERVEGEEICSFIAAK